MLLVRSIETAIDEPEKAVPSDCHLVWSAQYNLGVADNRKRVQTEGKDMLLQFSRYGESNKWAWKQQEQKMHRVI